MASKLNLALSHSVVSICIQQTVMLSDKKNVFKKKETQTDKQTLFWVEVIAVSLKWQRSGLLKVHILYVFVLL